MSKFYEFAVNDFKKRPFDLAAHTKGKVVLVVNVASQCGFTPQYAGLERLYKSYKDQGLVILGFPTNDFNQEPQDGEQLVQSCQLNFGVTFPIMEKCHVNGKEEHPIYAYLKKEKPGILGLQMVKWNFEKFLVGKDGQPVKRFASTTTPESIEAYVQAELAK
ncbi:hypothetical protein HDU76_009212 [Blyttiomyces sp. JEL0837]|nr:hypothetical protein HDU76_009212 [Blyttiomyces sp. JEL0837]